jgi:actin-like ATPase involved in cell morphogenesis
MNILGIDFGTTKTLAARWDERSQTARLIRLGRSGDAIPTTIYTDKSGKLEFGEDADDMRALDSAGWKGRIKRDLGKGSSIVLNGHSYRVVDLVAGYLSYILRRAEEEVFHGPVDRAVITVPALYGPAERDELKQAAAQAGFKTFELLDEPVAAGLAFLHDKTGTELGDAIMVFDWGGGTLDLALVESQDGEFKVNHRWIGGDKNLGGEDIDDSVIEGVDGLCSEEHGRVEEQEDQMLLHIQRNLKEGKELLSRRSEHTFRLRFKQPIEFKWSREEFETFTSTIVNRALDCLREQLRKMTNDGIKPKQVLLVGGSSSMPVIKRRIENELGIKPILWEHSQTAVALGAATHAVRSFRPSQPVSPGRGARPPQVQKKYSREVISAPSNSYSQSIDIGDANRVPRVTKGHAQTVIDKNKGGNSSTQQICMDEPDKADCITCGGIGQVISTRGFYQIQQNCPECLGDGKVIIPALKENDVDTRLKGKTLDNHEISGIYRGACVNNTITPPTEAIIKLILKRTCGKEILGDLSIYGELQGGSEFTGVLDGNELIFVTRTPNGKTSITWTGTIANNKITGTYEAIVDGFFVNLFGLRMQKGTWQCQKV